MPKHGTAQWELEQQNEVLVAVVRAMPQALQGVNPKQLLASLDGHGQVLEKAMAEMFTSFGSTVVPADDEWFELGVDYGIDLAEVVRSTGYNPEGWMFLGPAQEGRETHRAKLIRLGPVRNLAEAEQYADAQGYRLLGGHAREPFKREFPRSDGRGTIVFGGSQWQAPGGDADVTYLYDLGDRWHSDFRWSRHDFGEACRWAVISK